MVRTMGGPLNAKQARFCSEYLVDLNAKQAAIRAGYSTKTAESQGSRLLSHAKVAARISELQKSRFDRLEIKADDVLRELLTFARTDLRKAFDGEGRLLPIHELPEDVARAISGVEVEQIFEGSGQERYHAGNLMKVKLWDKVRGLELLGKHLKLFTDKAEHGGSVSIRVVDPYAEKPRG